MALMYSKAQVMGSFFLIWHQEIIYQVVTNYQGIILDNWDVTPKGILSTSSVWSKQGESHRVCGMKYFSCSDLVIGSHNLPNRRWQTQKENLQ